jgi:hypothetical protein
LTETTLTVRAVHFYTEKMYFLEDLDEEEYEIAIKVGFLLISTKENQWGGVNFRFVFYT